MTRDDVQREAVYEEFGSAPGRPSTDRMADEIVRLRSILAALREPSERIVDTLCEEREVETETDRCYIVGILRAAVAAAEKEVES